MELKPVVPSPRRRVWISLCLVLLAIWGFRFILPSRDPLFTQIGTLLGHEGSHPGQAAAHGDTTANKDVTTVDSTYITGQLPSDPNIASVDISAADAPFIVWPLKRLCAEQTDWVEGLIFVCDNNFGGIGNIRGFILTCIRYGIEAGATGLTMPRIRKRGENIGSLFENDIRPFDYIFDEGHFRGALAQACPQITIYKDDYSDVPNADQLKDVPQVNFVRAKAGAEAEEDSLDVNSTVPVHVITPADYRCHLRAIVTANYIPITAENAANRWPTQNATEMVLEPDNEGGDTGNGDCGEFHHHAERWGDNFRWWLFDERRISESGVPAPSAKKPFLVRMSRWVLFQWPVHKDGAEFMNTYGQLLKFKRPVLEMGKKVLGKMHNMSATVHAARSGQTSVDKQHGGKKSFFDNGERGFLGLHLRTESDIDHAGWPGYQELLQGFLAKAIEHSFDGGIAYVATGNVSEARKLEHDAKEALGLKVVDKRKLLEDEPEALAELEAMTWDHQGLVDFVVMAASDMFLGSQRSSFSVWLTARRAVMVDGGIHARAFKARVNKDDGASFLVGPKLKYWQDWLWFYDGTWP